MKSLIITILACLPIFSFSQSKVYTVDTEKSQLIWTANKVGGSHTGNISVKSGQFEIKDQLIVKGKFIIDMNSITCSDITDPSTNASLVGHLTSADFFESKTYTESILEIEKTEKIDGEFYKATGYLTIKGVRKPYTFKFAYKNENQIFVGVADLEINRADFNVKYGSESFFKNLGDKVIYDIFKLNIKIIAKV